MLLIIEHEKEKVLLDPQEVIFAGTYDNSKEKPVTMIFLRGASDVILVDMPLEVIEKALTDCENR